MLVASVSHDQNSSTAVKSRAGVLDALRGFALLGIVIINAQSIFAVSGSIPQFTYPLSAADRFLQDLILFFVESKFFTLFSLLFGIGFAIQMQSASKANTKFFPRISRRLLALLLFGALHIALFWDGDILVIYAVTGMLLFFLRNISDKAIKRWVICLLAIPSALVIFGLAFTLVGRLDPGIAAGLSLADKELASSFANLVATQPAIFAAFADAIPLRIESYFEVLPLLLSRIPTVLAMFLIGLYIGRKRIFADTDAWTPQLRKWRNLGLSLGFGLALLVVLATKFLPPTSALVALIQDQYLVGPLVAMGLASGFALLYPRISNSWSSRSFVLVGRMALTNYILQSVVLTAIAYAWGFGLATKLSGYEVLAITVGLYALQVAASSLWLRFFEFGPLEWIWRCITYFRLMPLTKSATSSEG
ncbi:MAG: hypothetical protein RL719_541 [Actinomycetota bacterium]|jgi:uncharacterized protein